MPPPTCDVLIVGARCAGSALATFLARAGLKVLAVDRAALPSDQVLSTHTIHPPGIDILDELGVGDAIRDVTPPTRTVRLRKGDAWAQATFQEGRAGYCPRRERLDGLLQEAASAAGAGVRDRTRAVALLRENGRVSGARLEHDGSQEDVRADLVVGADGRHSFVAGEVGADEYMAYDAPRAMYWAYWNAPAAWRSERYPFDMYLAFQGPDIRVIFQTDHDQLLIGSLPPVEVAREWRAHPLESLQANLTRDDVIGPLIADTPPDSEVRGTLKERYFFREAIGPGWALVGDAGHHKEFVVGDGITEALLQAKGLAGAIQQGSDAALTRWWRQRDVDALPGYFWGRDEGSLAPPTSLEQLVIGKVARSEELQRRMTRLPEHQCSPYDVLPPSAIVPTVLGAVARGRFGVIPEFLAQGRRAMAYGRTLRERRALLAETGRS